MRSKFEVRFAADLENRGIAFEYEAEALTYVIPRKYFPDWKVKGPAGSPCFIETKGVLDSEDRSKLLAVISQHPGIDLRIVFQRASNKLYKGSKTSYGQWATKHGIPWSEGKAPASWFAKK